MSSVAGINSVNSTVSTVAQVPGTLWPWLEALFLSAGNSGSLVMS